MPAPNSPSTPVLERGARLLASQRRLNASLAAHRVDERDQRSLVQGVQARLRSLQAQRSMDASRWQTSVAALEQSASSGDGGGGGGASMSRASHRSPPPRSSRRSLPADRSVGRRAQWEPLPSDSPLWDTPAGTLLTPAQQRRRQQQHAATPSFSRRGGALPPPDPSSSDYEAVQSTLDGLAQQPSRTDPRDLRGVASSASSAVETLRQVHARLGVEPLAFRRERGGALAAVERSASDSVDTPAALRRAKEDAVAQYDARGMYSARHSERKNLERKNLEPSHALKMSSAEPTPTLSYAQRAPGSGGGSGREGRAQAARGRPVPRPAPPPEVWESLLRHTPSTPSSFAAPTPPSTRSPSRSSPASAERERTQNRGQFREWLQQKRSPPRQAATPVAAQRQESIRDANPEDWVAQYDTSGAVHFSPAAAETEEVSLADEEPAALWMHSDAEMRAVAEEQSKRREEIAAKEAVEKAARRGRAVYKGKAQALVLQRKREEAAAEAAGAEAQEVAAAAAAARAAQAAAHASAVERAAVAEAAERREDEAARREAQEQQDAIIAAAIQADAAEQAAMAVDAAGQAAAATAREQSLDLGDSPPVLPDDDDGRYGAGNTPILTPMSAIAATPSPEGSRSTAGSSGGGGGGGIGSALLAQELQWDSPEMPLTDSLQRAAREQSGATDSDGSLSFTSAATHQSGRRWHDAATPEREDQAPAWQSSPDDSSEWETPPQSTEEPAPVVVDGSRTPAYLRAAFEQGRNAQREQRQRHDAAAATEPGYADEDTTDESLTSTVYGTPATGRNGERLPGGNTRRDIKQKARRALAERSAREGEAESGRGSPRKERFVQRYAKERTGEGLTLGEFLRLPRAAQGQEADAACAICLGSLAARSQSSLSAEHEHPYFDGVDLGGDEALGDNEPSICLPCGHAFHRSCAGDWLKQHNTCPSCRRVLGK